MRAIALAISLILSFMIPWDGVIQVAGFGNGTKIIGFVLAGFWLVTVLITGRFRRPSPFHLVLALFVSWNALSIFWSKDPDVTLAHVATWAQLLLLAIIWWDLYATQSSIFAGLQAYILGAYVAVGGAVVNYFSGYQFYTHYDRYSPGETNPDGFGLIMALGIPVAWYLATSENNSKLSGLLRWVNFLYLPAALLGIALSGTRTALIASIPGMIFGISSLARVRASTRGAFLVLFIAAILILLPYVQTQSSFQRLGTTTTELTEGDLNNRTNNWREGLAAFAEHPILGIGSDMYPTVNQWDKAAHNSFLAVLVEVGLIGFALFAFMLTIAVLEAWKLPAWDSRFWLTTLFVWALGASTLTWGHRKPTWLFLNLVVASGGALISHRYSVLRTAGQSEPERQSTSYIERRELPHGTKERPHLV